MLFHVCGMWSIWCLTCNAMPHACLFHVVDQLSTVVLLHPMSVALRLFAVLLLMPCPMHAWLWAKSPPTPSLRLTLIIPDPTLTQTLNLTCEHKNKWLWVVRSWKLAAYSKQQIDFLFEVVFEKQSLYNNSARYTMPNTRCLHLPRSILDNRTLDTRSKRELTFRHHCRGGYM